MTDRAAPSPAAPTQSDTRPLPWLPMPDRLGRTGGLFGRGRIRLRTLTLLRWFAVFGQLAALIIVSVAMGFDLPLLPCLIAIGASAVLNIAVSLRLNLSKWLNEAEARNYLAFDLVQLFALLYLTGGLGNPFALLFLAPVTISATMLGLTSTLILGGLSLIFITALGLYHLPLPWYPGEMLALPPVYVIGIWAALVLGLVFNTLYAWRISQEADRMRTAMDATAQVLAREQRLAALGALAAAAAHELGTPLATISLVSRELERDLPEDSPYTEDIGLLRSQAERCREILSRLSKQPSAEDAVHDRIGLEALIEEIAAPHRGFGVTIHLHIGAADGLEKPEGAVWRRPEILHGLGNLIENAVDFARARVAIHGEWSERELTVRIVDDGPGFAPEIMERLGEPYVTTRRARRRAGVADSADPSPHGMGLGFFIAKTLLEYTQGRIGIANRAEGAEPAARGGAEVTVIWPREAIEAMG